jgi:4-amino-4-deoxy-L-arabinose transferase-like glycosyltransferase
MDLPNVPFCLFLLYFMVMGLRRWWRQDRTAALPYLVAVLVFPIPYYFTHSSMDYRQPLEPIIILLVTLGLFGTRTSDDEAKSTPEHVAEYDAVLV